MVELFKKYLKARLFEYRRKRAIRKARHDADLYGKKFLVLVFKGKPVVVSMQGIRQMIRQKRFAKGFTTETATKLAIYIAYPKQHVKCS